MILRELVTRLGFQVDTTPLRTLDQTLAGVKGSIAKIAGTALGGWALHAGTNVELLKQQLKELEGGAVGPLYDAISDLSMADPFGNASIFRETDLQRAGVALRRMGFDSQEAAEMLKFSSLVTIRAGGDIQEAVKELGSGVMEGGLVQTLRGLGLLSRQTEFELRTIESKIAASSGVTAELHTREWRRKIMEVVRQGSPELQKTFAEAMTSPAAEALRVESGLGNLWDRVSSGIIRALGPALDYVSALLNRSKELEPVFDGLRVKAQGFSNALGEMGPYLTPIKEFLLAPLEHGAGMTIGGLLGLFLTKGWKGTMLGMALGGSLEEAAQTAAEGTPGERRKDEGSWHWLLRYLARLAAMGQGGNDIWNPENKKESPATLEENSKRLQEEAGAMDRARARLDEELRKRGVGQTGPLGMNWFGNMQFNIYAAPGQSEESVGQAVWDRVLREFQRLDMDQRSSIEVPSTG